MARLSCPGHRPHEKRARRGQKNARAGRVGRGQLAIEIRPNLRLATCRSGRLPPSRRPLETRRNGNLSGRGYRQTLVAVPTREGDPLWRATSTKRGERRVLRAPGWEIKITPVRNKKKVGDVATFGPTSQRQKGRVGSRRADCWVGETEMHLVDVDALQPRSPAARRGPGAAGALNRRVGLAAQLHGDKWRRERSHREIRWMSRSKDETELVGPPEQSRARDWLCRASPARGRAAHGTRTRWEVAGCGLRLEEQDSRGARQSVTR